jgi:Helicase associated domain
LVAFFVLFPQVKCGCALLLPQFFFFLLLLESRDLQLLAMPKLINIHQGNRRAALSEISNKAAGVVMTLHTSPEARGLGGGGASLTNNSNGKKTRVSDHANSNGENSSNSFSPQLLPSDNMSSSTTSRKQKQRPSLEASSSSSSSSSSSKQVKRWDERFDELVKFKVLYGSCRVPHRYPDNPGLSRWVVYMRSSYQAGTLPADRVDKLNQVGFIWSDRGHTTWDKRCQQLELYRAMHGTSRVSCDTPESAQLWRWSSVQRANYRLGKLSADRIRALDALGFIWDVDQHDWDAKFDDLAEFYRTFGHTRLPNKDPYKKLFLWARVQRTKFHDNSLSAERVAKLQLLDFGWEKNSMYTTSTGHVTMDGGNNNRSTSMCAGSFQILQGESASPPIHGPYHDQPSDLPAVTGGFPFSVARTMIHASSAAATTTITKSHPSTMVPKVSILKSPPPSSKSSSSGSSAKKELRGFDRLLQLAELARTFSPVPMSPVRPIRP